MLQNKYTFNQSSAELEIIGLPDYSKNDNEKKNLNNIKMETFNY